MVWVWVALSAGNILGFCLRDMVFLLCSYVAIKVTDCEVYFGLGLDIVISDTPE